MTQVFVVVEKYWEGGLHGGVTFTNMGVYSKESSAKKWVAEKEKTIKNEWDSTTYHVETHELKK